MAAPPKDFFGFLGRHVLPYANRRVVCPPGRPEVHGRPNIVIATPKRCGTHVLIDMILNNMPAYQNQPLYIDLDKAWKRKDLGEDLFGCINTRSGYVIKTHLPVGAPGAADSQRILALLDASVVLTVHRNSDAMVRSTARWMQVETSEVSDAVQADYANFWGFWQNRPRIGLEFEELFSTDRMQSVLADLSVQTRVERTARYVPPPAKDRLGSIYMAKAMTRLMGCYAPKIDTTIATLKSGR